MSGRPGVKAETMTGVTRRQQRYSGLSRMDDVITPGDHPSGLRTARRVTVGEGITGWVAANRTAQNLGDAANDPRAYTVPGTEADLDES